MAKTNKTNNIELTTQAIELLQVDRADSLSQGAISNRDDSFEKDAIMHDGSDALEYSAALRLSERHISDKEFAKLEGYAAEIFSAFGLDLNTPSTVDTPRRFIKAMFDATEGYDGDPKLVKAFDTECHDVSGCGLSQIIQGPIPFYALCEHHALPFHGRAYVGYIAKDRIIGISKLTRLVRLFSKRFAVQERIGQEVADLLDATIHPQGIAIYIEAHHLCMEMRGVREINPMTRTTVWRGSYADDPALRSEFFTACGLPHHG